MPAARAPLADFLRSRGLSPALAAVIRNGRPLAPAEVTAAILENGDRLEITPDAARRR